MVQDLQSARLLPIEPEAMVLSRARFVRTFNVHFRCEQCSVSGAGVGDKGATKMWNMASVASVGTRYRYHCVPSRNGLLGGSWGGNLFERQYTRKYEV